MPEELLELVDDEELEEVLGEPPPPVELDELDAVVELDVVAEPPAPPVPLVVVLLHAVAAASRSEDANTADRWLKFMTSSSDVASWATG